MRVFITSTGTGIGKSFVTAALTRLGRHSKSFAAYKPLITGFDPAQVAESDTGLLLQALGLPLTPENIDRVSPWRFAAPLAPGMAARLEGRRVDFGDLVAHSRKILQGPEDHVLIEGIGGVMVPLDDTHTVADWIAALDIPAILVTGSYLGALSHTLTALEVMKFRKIPLQAIILNESKDSGVSLTATADELRRWTAAPVITVARRAEGDWRDVPELGVLFD